MLLRDNHTRGEFLILTEKGRFGVQREKISTGRKKGATSTGLGRDKRPGVRTTVRSGVEGRGQRSGIRRNRTKKRGLGLRY